MVRRTVLHLIDTGGPGGAETIFLNLVEGMPTRGWRSVAVVPTRDWLAQTLEARGITPILVPTDRAFDVPYLARVAALARGHDVDVIQAHLLTSSVYGSLAGRLTRRPVVCTFHGHADVAPDESLKGLKFRIIDRRSNRVVFVSEALRRAVLARTGIDAGRTRVIPNGIDGASFRPREAGDLRDELGVRSDEILLGAVGNVRPSKAYDVLLHATARLRRRSVRCRVVVVGQAKGPLFRELEALRDRLGLGDVVSFVGFRQNVERWINACDVYVISSSAEGFSLSTVQALACGTPVVATRCGGPEEIVEDGRTGLLVDAGSPEALAGAIETLVRDADRRSRLARAAPDSVRKRFTLDAMLDEYERLYAECSSKHRSRATHERLAG